MSPLDSPDCNRVTRLHGRRLHATIAWLLFFVLTLAACGQAAEVSQNSETDPGPQTEAADGQTEAVAGGESPAADAATAGVTDAPADGASSYDQIEGEQVRLAFSSLPSAIDIVGVKVVEILREHGAEVEVINLDGGARAVQAVVGGRADVASNALDDAINGGLTAFALNRPKNMYAMIAKPGIDSVEDLEGVTIGVGEPGAVQNVLSEAILEKYGIPLDAVTFANIGGSGERTTALLSGRVDATMVYGDHHVRLLNEGFQTVTTASEEFPGLHDDMFVARREWLEENPELATALARAQLEAAQWFNEAPEDWAALAVDNVDGLDEDVAMQFYDLAASMDMYPLDGLMSEDSLMQTYEMLLSSGAIEETPFDEWATVEYLNAARRELGLPEM